MPALRQIPLETQVKVYVQVKNYGGHDSSVSAAVDEFDAVWDEGMEDYLASGGQDIMTEREEAWNAVYSTDNID